jgi:hypothetical protein
MMALVVGSSHKWKCVSGEGFPDLRETTRPSHRCQPSGASRAVSPLSSDKARQSRSLQHQEGYHSCASATDPLRSDSAKTSISAKRNRAPVDITGPRPDRRLVMALLSSRLSQCSACKTIFARPSCGANRHSWHAHDRASILPPTRAAGQPSGTAPFGPDRMGHACKLQARGGDPQAGRAKLYFESIAAGQSTRTQATSALGRRATFRALADHPAARGPPA